MKRQVSLEEISDGKLYDLNDMVKADCGGCKGCFACCCGMGKSIILTPLDIFDITKNLNCTFEELLMNKIELNVVDGLILPNLKMNEKEEKCAFLNSHGRCSIHEFRPGLCRIFPLGRYYEKNEFRYFLQIYECKKENRSKIKVRKWIDIPNLKENEIFIMEWHNLLVKLEDIVIKNQGDSTIKNINLFLLNLFYIKSYEEEKNFYQQFTERVEIIKRQYKLQSDSL